MASSARRYLVFVSSVQKELAAERRALKECVHNDPLLRQYFEVFLFEDLPASGRRADEVYLSELQERGVLAKRGHTGRSAHYVLTSKPDINPTNPPSGSQAKPAKNPTNPPPTSATSRGKGLTKGSQKTHDKPRSGKRGDQPK